jgi:hypothetical protein
MSKERPLGQLNPVQKLGRVLLVVAVNLVMAMALAEVGAFLYHRVALGELHSYSQAALDRSLVMRNAGPDLLAEAVKPVSRSISYTLHPYLGFVLEPGSRYLNYDVEISQRGFVIGDAETLPDDAFVVAITGGSLALRLFIDARETLIEGLASLPEARGRKVHVVCLANSAYKQPQELFSVVWYLVQGGRIDLLLNLDGFNEVTHIPHGIYAAYPYHWGQLVAAGDPDELAAIGRIVVLREERVDLAQSWARFGGSVLANTVWRLRDRALEGRIAAGVAALARLDVKNTFRTRGPAPPEGSSPAELMADMWRDGSLQLAKLGRGSGFRYLHFLQPNQYVDDSKLFSSQERARTLGIDSFNRDVDSGYPKLQQAGSKLVQDGVEFHDLTLVFRGLAETIYDDGCCHVNPKGSRIIAQAMVAAVAAGGMAQDP